MGETKTEEIDPDTLQTRDEAWEWAHRQYETQRKPLANSRKRPPSSYQQKKK